MAFIVFMKHGASDKKVLQQNFCLWLSSNPNVQLGLGTLEFEESLTILIPIRFTDV